MKSVLALFFVLALCSIASATNPRSFRSSRDFCPQDRGFNSRNFHQSRDFRDFRDFDQPRTIITETEIRRGPFGRVRRSETTRTVR
jgi:hypothetical protein